MRNSEPMITDDENHQKAFDIIFPYNPAWHAYWVDIVIQSYSQVSTVNPKLNFVLATTVNLHHAKNSLFDIKELARIRKEHIVLHTRT